MSNNLRSTNPSSSTDVELLNNTNDPPCQRITKFIDDIGDILSTVDNTHLTKFIRQCSGAYNFINITPMPSLADCMDTMIRDQNTLERESKYYHYYNAMILEFLQRCLITTNADQNAINNLTPKLNESLEKFKEFYETV